MNKENRTILGSNLRSSIFTLRNGKDVWQYTACLLATTLGVVSCSDSHRSTGCSFFEIPYIVTYSHQSRLNQLLTVVGISMYSMFRKSANDRLCTNATTRYSSHGSDDKYSKHPLKMVRVPPFLMLTAETTIVFLARSIIH